MTQRARNKSVMMTYGFFDEVVKIASAAHEAEWDRRMAPLQRRFEEGLDKIFRKQVPERIKAMLEKKFPGMKTTAKEGVVRRPSTPHYMTEKRLRAFSKTSGLFQDIVHHPLTQAIGYAALAGEGAHAFAHGYGTPRMKNWATSTRSGKATGIGSLGVASAFLAAEGASALADLMGGKKHGDGKSIQITLKLQPPDLPGRSSNTGPSGRDTALRLPKMPSGFRKMVIQRRRK